MLRERRWRFHVEGEAHEVVLRPHADQSFEVLLDGAVARPRGAASELLVGGDHRLLIHGHVVVVHHRPGWVRDHLDLSVDGLSVETGKPPALPEVSRGRSRRIVAVYCLVGGPLLLAMGWWFSDRLDLEVTILGVVATVVGILGLLGVRGGGVLDDA